MTENTTNDKEKSQSTHSIDIQAKSTYAEDFSTPEEGRFMFSYRVSITNCGSESVKLLRRHWQIVDENNHIEEVKGKGVVGMQPEILPGESFEYSSSAVLATEIGTMQGSYQMEDSKGQLFDAPIPAFLLAMPNLIH